MNEPNDLSLLGLIYANNVSIFRHINKPVWEMIHDSHNNFFYLKKRSRLVRLSINPEGVVWLTFEECDGRNERQINSDQLKYFYTNEKAAKLALADELIKLGTKMKDDMENENGK